MCLGWGMKGIIYTITCHVAVGVLECTRSLTMLDIHNWSDFHSTKSTNFLLQAIIAQTILILGWGKLPT